MAKKDEERAGSDAESDAESESDAHAESDAESVAESESDAHAASEPSVRRAVKIAAGSSLVLAALLLAGLGLLPARYLPVDVPVALFALAHASIGVGLSMRTAWAARAARIVAASTLVAGALLCTALAFTAAHISGLYGPVGSGGALLLGVVALLLLPYLVLVPAAQLWLFLPQGEPRR